MIAATTSRIRQDRDDSVAARDGVDLYSEDIHGIRSGEVVVFSLKVTIDIVIVHGRRGRSVGIDRSLARFRQRIILCSAGEV